MESLRPYQHVFERNPGLEGVAYAEIVPRDKKSDYIAQMSSRTLGSKGIFPEQNDTDSVVLTFLEEVALGSQQYSGAIGYDMASSEVRRKALDFARAKNTVAGTAPMKLFGSKDTGLILVLPLNNDANANHGYASPTFGYAIVGLMPIRLLTIQSGNN
jgi:CHASE1-domain containing sensor protein